MSYWYPDGTSQADFDRAHDKTGDSKCQHGISVDERCFECWPVEIELKDSRA